MTDPKFKVGFPVIFSNIHYPDIHKRKATIEKIEGHGYRISFGNNRYFLAYERELELDTKLTEVLK